MNPAATVTRYAIKSATDDLWIHALAPYTNPSSTDDETRAKTWASAAAAQAAVRQYHLTNAEVVSVQRQPGSRVQ